MRKLVLVYVNQVCWQYNIFVALTFTWNSYSAFSFCGAGVSLLLAYMAWRRRQTLGSLAFSALMFSVAFWSAAYGMDLGSKTLAEMIFWSKVEYLGSSPIAGLFLYFTLLYTHYDNLLPKRWLLWLCVEPVLIILLVWTNELHHWVWVTTSVDTSGVLPVFDAEHGPAFWINIIYIYALLLSSSVLLLLSPWQLPRAYRGQVLFIFFGSLAPWVGNGLYVAHVVPFDLAPFGFVITGIVIAFSLYRYHFLDLSPVAREKVLESMSDGVLVLDKQNRIVDLNPAAGNIFGQPVSQLIGCPLRSLFLDRPDLLELYHDLPDGRGEITLGASPEQRFYEMTLSTLTDSSERVSGRLMVLRDITERKRYEDAVNAAKEFSDQLVMRLSAAKDEAEAANRAKSSFLATTSHELRTPLTSIIGYSELLTEKAGQLSAEHMQRYLGHIRTSSQHLLNIINDILDFSKIEAGRLELNRTEFSIDAPLNDALELVRPQMEKNENRLMTEISEDVGNVFADPMRVRQVLLNLLSNAAKFTMHGSVTVRAWRGLFEQTPCVYIQVVDTGIGMTQEQLAGLFHPFTQASQDITRLYGGTGLGLAISQRLCELMEGGITVESEYGRGSAFTVHLPLVSAAEIQQPGATRSEINAPPVGPVDFSLDGLPAGWLVGMRKAVVLGDWAHALSLAQQLQSEYPEISQALVHMVGDYEYETLLKYIDQASQ